MLIIGHMAVGLIFGMISVGYSVLMGHSILRMFIMYTVSGTVGLLLSATLTYVREETRRIQLQGQRRTDRASHRDRVPHVGRSTRDCLDDFSSDSIAASERTGSPIRMGGRDRTRPMASDRRFGPEGDRRRLLVLFDIDGTLLDGAPMIVRCVADAFRAVGEAPPSPEAVRNVIGLSTDVMVGHLTRALPVDQQAKILSGYRVAFFTAIKEQEDPPVFPGVGRALVRLRHAGVTLGIATGRSRRGVGHLLDTLGWRPLFRTVQHGDANPSKPDPTMIYRALAEADFAPEETVMVGDKCCDMQMAREAGVGGIGVAWGYDQRALLLGAGAQSIVEDVGHLKQVLLALPAGRIEAECSR